jgi:hypothetical protein
MWIVRERPSAVNQPKENLPLGLPTVRHAQDRLIVCPLSKQRIRGGELSVSIYITRLILLRIILKLIPLGWVNMDLKWVLAVFDFNCKSAGLTIWT